jgi:hypothetical protein
MNIPPLGAEMFNSVTRTDPGGGGGGDEENIHLSPFFESVHKGFLLTARLMPLYDILFFAIYN